MEKQSRGVASSLEEGKVLLSARHSSTFPFFSSLSAGASWPKRKFFRQNCFDLFNQKEREGAETLLH